MTPPGGSTLRIYVASSWRNLLQPELVSALREDGHVVYDFREPTAGGRGFSWHELDNSLPVGPADLQHAQAVQIVVLHGGPKEMGLKLCARHRDLVLRESTPREGE